MVLSRFQPLAPRTASSAAVYAAVPGFVVLLRQYKLRWSILPSHGQQTSSKRFVREGCGSINHLNYSAQGYNSWRSRIKKKEDSEDARSRIEKKEDQKPKRGPRRKQTQTKPERPNEDQEEERVHRKA
ncbi:hypothetical protein RB195_023068 [Necator americanus]|uniref:Uncharacterized protein n=1 Tax=Necator americanus TaxID=51031 RepID=A0ABR1EID2_NECAM